MLWLLASEHKDGTFDASIEELVFRLRMDESDIIAGLKALIDKGFLILASGELAECLRSDSDVLSQRERQRQSSEGEIKKGLRSIAREARTSEQSVDEHFELFWNAYDKKRGRSDCEKVWKRINPDDRLAQQIVRAARTYAAATPEKAYRKDPVRWLTHKCWNDEVVNRQEQMSSYDKSIKAAGLAIFGNLENYQPSEKEVYDHEYSSTETRAIAGVLDKPPF
jgi:hypothetical protein